MKSSKYLIFPLLIFVIGSSCGPGTAAVTPTAAEAAESTEVPDGPNYGLLSVDPPAPLTFPDMYIVIDESGSMIEKEATGSTCDPQKLRYKIPLFMASILKSLESAGLAQPPNIYLFLKDEQKKPKETVSITPSAMVDTLKFRYENPPEGITKQPFELESEQSPDTLEYVINNAKEGDLVLLLTDGDFRKNRPKDENAEKTGEEVEELFASKNKNISPIIFLLCSRRIKDQDFYRDVWGDIQEYEQAVIYGHDVDDFSDKKKLDDAVGKLLVSWLGFWKSEQVGKYPLRGWGWREFISDADSNSDLIDNLPPNLIRVGYRAVSFEYPSQDVSITAQVDQNIVTWQDNMFPTQVDNFIPPAANCGRHTLDFDESSISEGTFYWWWADIPELSASAEIDLGLINDIPVDDYSINIMAQSSLTKGEFLKPGDLDKYFICLGKLWLGMEQKYFPLQYESNVGTGTDIGGRLVLDNIKNPFVNEEYPVPNVYGVIPLTLLGEWYENNSQGTMTLPIQSTSFAKIRYFPVYLGLKEVASMEGGTFSELSGASQTFNITIRLDYIGDKYYPPQIFENYRWKPTIYFEGASCPPGLTKHIKPPYPPIGGQSLNSDVAVIIVSGTELRINIRNDSAGMVGNCEKLTLNWEEWPENDWPSPNPNPLFVECPYGKSLSCK